MKAELFDRAIVSNHQKVVDFTENIQKQQMVVAIILWHLS